MHELAHKQDEFWSGFIKRDRSFLSQTSTPFDEDVDRYSRELCVGLEGTKALEIGCGDGADAIGMIRQYELKSVVAIDVSKERVHIARRTVEQAGLSERIRILQMDAQQFAFPEGSFDFAFCNSVLLFLDRERFFPEIARVLRPGGRLFLFRESLAGNPLLAAYRAFWPKRRKRAAETLARRLTVREIEEAGQRYFASIEHREFYLFFSILCQVWPWLVNNVFRGRVEYSRADGRWSRAVDDMLLKRIPLLRHFAYVSVACFTTLREKR
jgi:SAM-dependent methyltransferase